MTHTVVGLFDDRDEARAAMNDLARAGFAEDDIDLSNHRMAETDMDDDTDMDDEKDMGNRSGSGMGDRISNFFNSLFDSDDATTRNYTYAANEAEAILTIHTESQERAETARDIMDRNGAIDVDERGATYAAGSGDEDDDVTGGRTMPVVEERLDVGKREVERGSTRVRSRIVEKPVERTIRLREEHVTVNRRPVDREVTDADRQRFQPGEMVITEHAEVPVVGKEARVVEEIEVGKNVTERDETVRETLRNTQVDIDEVDTPASTQPAKAKRAKP